MKTDRLTFCRCNLDNLDFDEISNIYNMLTIEYADDEQIMENKMENIMLIFELMWDYNVSWNDWFVAMMTDDYHSTDKYIGIGREGIYSYNDFKEFIWFISEKMNGEAMEKIEEYLSLKGITNKED